MTERDRSSLNPPQQSPRWGLWLAVALTLLLAAGSWWNWQRQAAPAAPVAATVGTAAPDTAPAVQAPGEAGPGPLFPLVPVAPQGEALPPLATGDDYVARAVQDLLGQGKAAALLQLDGFVRRAVATVDNLARDQAPAGMWPVQPTPERFSASGSGGAQTIALDNSARYNRFVQGVESVNVQRAAALYVRLYPLFQQAYEELGYPGKHFNDRLVAVIDHLLQAPEPEGPVHVTLTQVKGDIPSIRPWVRYEFADAQLEALSSGQKIMVRVGLVNERRLKQRLLALRAAVTSGAEAKAPR